ncbi:Glucosaminyl phosphatidylinositol (GlcN-PI) nositol acylation protein [Thecaphora frezii]
MNSPKPPLVHSQPHHSLSHPQRHSRHQHQHHQTTAAHHLTSDAPPLAAPTTRFLEQLHSHAFQPTAAADPAPAAHAASYKHIKEAWIADQTGGSIHTINLLSLTMLTTYALWAVLRARRLRFVARSDLRQPSQLPSAPLRAAMQAVSLLPDGPLEFLVLIAPAIGALTVLSDRLWLLNLAIASLASFLYFSTTEASPSDGKRPANANTKADADAKVQTKKQRWSKRNSDEDDDDDDDDDLLEELLTDTDGSFSGEPPIRVSIDSAAEAAHLAAAPPTPYSPPPGSATSDRSFYDSPSSSPTNFYTFSYGGGVGGDGGRGLRAPSSEDPQAGRRGSLPDTLSGHREGALALTTSSLSESAPGSRTASPLIGGSGGGSSRGHWSSLSSSSPISPLARSVVDPLEPLRRSLPRPEAARPDPIDPALFVREQPFLTVYRAHMMLMTILCILAVDFPAFPREFSKCESWGTSLMDLGVGSFVFSLGIVSALPFLRSPRNRFAPLKGQLVRDLRRSLPLLALGGVRVVMVKGVEYPEHVSEYGVHWNFFFTLALLPFAATLSRPLSRRMRYNFIGLAMSVVHQLVLKLTDLEAWALSSTLARDTLVRQNKEGIASLPGYLAIFLLGLDLGHYVLPLDPYFAYRRLRQRSMKPKPGKLAMVLASLSVLWWSGYGVACLVGLETSRRLANLSYVLWVVAYNTSFLLAYVVIYVGVLKPAEQTASRAQLGETTSAASITPRLLADLNRHSLASFLAANVLTGVVNMSMQTMYAADWMAVAILTIYTAASCGLATVMERLGWRLRV